MPEACKNLINAQTVRTARRHLSRAWPALDGKRFETLALKGLEALAPPRPDLRDAARMDTRRQPACAPPGQRRQPAAPALGRLTLQSTSARRQKLVVDYAVHHMKANGQTAPKVFKGWVVELASHETRVLRKRHALVPITTRRYHPGRHAIDIQVNGEVLAERPFELRT